jgi:glycine dehydrogenase
MLMPANQPLSALENAAEFVARHIGIEPVDEVKMLSAIGAASRRALIEAVVPRSIVRGAPMALPAPASEAQALAELRALASRNSVLKSLHRPGLSRHAHARRDPAQRAREPGLVHRVHAYQARSRRAAWRRSSTSRPWCCDLTGMAIAGSSMLDEATAAAGKR